MKAKTLPITVLILSAAALLTSGCDLFDFLSNSTTVSPDDRTATALAAIVPQPVLPNTDLTQASIDLTSRAVMTQEQAVAQSSNRATDTPSPTVTPTATLTPPGTPTGAKPLRGTVHQRSNVRYGAGAAFMTKYGVQTGTRLEVLARDVDGGWLQVQGVGGHNAGWINAKLLQLDGNADVMSLPEINPDTGLPVVTFYGPPVVTRVSSAGGQVTVEWAPVTVRADLMPGEGVPIYVVEVWSCNSGKKSYTVLGTNDTTTIFPVEIGCGQDAKALLRLQFKEGVSAATIIALPQ